MNDFERENKYLEYVLETINEEIEKKQLKIEELKRIGRTLSFEDVKRGAHLNNNSMLIFYDKLVKMLTRIIPSPYFGRIDFVPDDTNECLKIYIGKSNVTNDGKTIITDWRAPVCSLYYDQEIGDVSYNSPSGQINGELELKRQIIIEDSKLINVLDTSLVTNDELLQPYLSVNADNKMKTIIASIQKEQNQIIRKDMNKNIIVQGVAGSGKTSVALHRLAYLLYDAGSSIKANQFLVLGPNEYFLNYISGILPELEVEPVEQKTFFKLTGEYIQETLSSDNFDEQLRKKLNDKTFEKIQSYKSSLEFKDVVEKFMNEYLIHGIAEKDFEIDEQVVFTKEEIIKSLFSDGKKNLNIDKTCNVFIKRFKNNLESIYDNLNQKYKKIYINLPDGDPVRREAINKSMELKKTINEKGTKLIKDYFKKLKIKPLDIYKELIINLDKFETNLTKNEIDNIQKVSLQYLNKKKVLFEDLPALMLIKYMFGGEKLEYKHIVIDEAQDYGLFHFDIIKQIAPQATYSIYGDLAQSIYKYRSINSWEEVANNIFDNDCELINLRKSYRTTIEITDNANKILRKMNLKEAEPVIRHGQEVNFSNNSKNNDYKISKINEWVNKNYKTIAIICKNEAEALDVYEKLSTNGIPVKYMSSKEQQYKGGIFVLTSFSAKGLEFDAVMINDASEKKYNPSSENDMHLLYVAATRALHEQEILYDGKLCDVFEKDLNKNVDPVETKKLLKR